MQGKQLISVLIPVYNVDKYLKKCLETVINQTYKNIEIVLLDDGSTDNSLKIIEEYAKIDGRVRYYSRENRGLLPTRLELVEVCSGEAFAFIDSDDWVELDYIEKMATAMISFDSDIVRCGDIIEYIDTGKGKKYCKAYNKEPVVIEKEKNFEQLLYDLMTSFYYNSIHSVLVRRRIWGEELMEEIRVNQDVYIGEDVIFNCALYRKSKKVVTIPKYLYHYRKNPDSMMNSIMSLERFKKRIVDCFVMRKNIESLGVADYNLEDIWNASILRDIDECMNDLVKRCIDKKTVINGVIFVQNFLKENAIAKSRQYKYMFCDDSVVLKTVINKKWIEQRIKGYIKKKYNAWYCKIKLIGCQNDWK